MCIFVVLIFNLFFFIKKNLFKNLIFYLLIIFLSIKGFDGIKNLKLHYLEKNNPKSYKIFSKSIDTRPNRVEEVYILFQKI